MCHNDPFILNDTIRTGGKKDKIINIFLHNFTYITCKHPSFKKGEIPMKGLCVMLKNT